MISLTPRQQDALRFVVGFQAANGFSPCFSEIADGIGVKSKRNVAELLDGLEERGAIRRLCNRARAIEVLVPIAIPRAPDGAPLHSVRIEGLTA
jgi:SOS-response transcriptional repressor LexA